MGLPGKQIFRDALKTFSRRRSFAFEFDEVFFSK
jgi:hypothetical protein